MEKISQFMYLIITLEILFLKRNKEQNTFTIDFSVFFFNRIAQDIVKIYCALQYLLGFL